MTSEANEPTSGNQPPRLNEDRRNGRGGNAAVSDPAASYWRPSSLWWCLAVILSQRRTSSLISGRRCLHGQTLRFRFASISVRMDRIATAWSTATRSGLVIRRSGLRISTRRNSARRGVRRRGSRARRRRHVCSTSSMTGHSRLWRVIGTRTGMAGSCAGLSATGSPSATFWLLKVWRGAGTARGIPGAIDPSP